jgi:hypothetical protein
MGYIREKSTDRTLPLGPEQVIGRAPTCSLRLAGRYVSAQHARLRWSGQGWEVKDLGSRNGTFVDGARLAPGEGQAARRGSRIAFGKLDEEWELVDESPPRVMAIPADGGEPVLMEGELLALPSADDPRVTICRSAAGLWVTEQADGAVAPIGNLEIVDIGGRMWRFSCPEEICATTFGFSSTELRVRQLHLSFSVSRDEEHVQLLVTCGQRTLDLGTRARNYLLLTLARRRVADAKEGLPEASCGWIYQDDLSHDPSMAPPQLNLDVFRVRKQFAAAGVVDAVNVIERRSTTRQIRVGTGQIAIRTI